MLIRNRKDLPRPRFDQPQPLTMHNCVNSFCPTRKFDAHPCQERRFFNSPKALMMRLPLWPIGIGPRLWRLNPPCFQEAPKTPRQSEAATVEPIVVATALCRRAFGVADVTGR